MPLGTLGKYERLDVLGHGASGIVYLAKDTLLNKQVALKEVDVQAGDIRRFLEEARVMDRLRHPNIVEVNGVDRIDGKVVIAMEYVRGENLQEVLRQEGHLPLDRALNIAIQVLDALDFAHRMQTVHRDIKPANILLGRDGTIKIVDFGLAEILATNAYAGGAGTYAYMAPEDFAEEDHSDHQSDIWAVGVTLYEMLAGQRPFQVAKPKDPFAWKRVLENEPPTPITDYLPDASPALQAVLARALTREKLRRYPTAGAFRDDLIRLQAGQNIASATLRMRELTEPPRKEQTNGTAPETEPRTGPGVVVADVTQAVREKSEKRGRLPFTRPKAEVEARLLVEPERVNFGAVRKGDQRALKIQVRCVGVDGPAAGTVVRKPDWLIVQPPAFDRHRQTLTLTAQTEQAWETGDFEDALVLSTKAGTHSLPLHLEVLKARPSFWGIAWWYVPLFTCTLLPALAVATRGGVYAAGTAGLVPAAAVATGLLAMMLLLVGIVANIGVAERIACGVLTAAMAVVLGTAFAQSQLRAHDGELLLMTGAGVGFAFLLHCLTHRRWKLWAFLVAGLGLFLGAVFWGITSNLPPTPTETERRN